MCFFSATADMKETERQWREEFYTWKYTDIKEWRGAFDEYEALRSNHKRNEL